MISPLYSAVPIYEILIFILGFIIGILYWDYIRDKEAFVSIGNNDKKVKE